MHRTIAEGDDDVSAGKHSKTNSSKPAGLFGRFKKKDAASQSAIGQEPLFAETRLPLNSQEPPSGGEQQPAPPDARPLLQFPRKKKANTLPQEQEPEPPFENVTARHAAPSPDTEKVQGTARHAAPSPDTEVPVAAAPTEEEKAKPEEAAKHAAPALPKPPPPRTFSNAAKKVKPQKASLPISKPQNGGTPSEKDSKKKLVLPFAKNKNAKAAKAAEKEKIKKPGIFAQADQEKLSKAVYRIGISLLVVMIGLSIWMGRETYTLSGLQSWYQLQFTGPGLGNGYPVSIKGYNVAPKNFIHQGSRLAILSDTALTVYNQTGKEQYTVRHSFESPAMNRMGSKYILYDIGDRKSVV